MAQSKKVSELTQVGSINNDDEFLVIDKSRTDGPDAGTEGRTSKATLNQVRNSLFPQGLPEGEKGEPGVSVTGPQGSKGITGFQGATGAASTVAGAQGEKGSRGASIVGDSPTHQWSGSSLSFQNPDGSMGTPTNLIGPQGSQGSRGAASTASGPQGLQGFQGRQGARGVQGFQGFQGRQGARGAASTVAGPQGLQGAASTVRGLQGFQGRQGAASTVRGLQGFQGRQGAASTVRGLQGFQGRQGAASTVRGLQGFQGRQGARGVQGIQGARGVQGSSGSPWSGGTFSGSTTHNSISTFKNDIRFEGSRVEIGDYHVDDSILDMSCRSIEGAQNHQGRIKFVPAHGQAMYRVRGYIDLMTDSVSDNATPVVRIQGAYTSSSMQNAVMQDNRIKLEVKGTINAVGNISTDSSIYADNYYGNVNQNLDISPGTWTNKVRITHGDGMLGNIIKYPIAEFDKDEIVFHKPVKFEHGFDNIAILTGTIANGATIPIPVGFTGAQCKMIVGCGSVSSSHGQHNSNHSMTMTVDETTRVVTTTGIGTGSGTANYMIIGIK